MKGTHNLQAGLLFSRGRPTSQGPTFDAVLNAHGQYSTFQFVLRLSPQIHRLLAMNPAGIYSSGKLGFERAQAFSTLLHETVHWWQHVGSTYGLMLSLTHPVQLHGNYNHLRELIQRVGFKKDIRKLAATMPGPKGQGTLSGLANMIVNNHFDFGAFRGLTLSRETLRQTGDDPLFESVGHAFELAYGHNLNSLASTVDREHRVIPDPRQWEAPFNSLREKQEEGYYYGSPVTVWPIGAREIFEGQACFAQMQYLAFASNGGLRWDDFRDIGMLHGVYEEAFKFFLERTELPWPPDVIHPTTALFLLICDMSINPGSGFPFPLHPFYPTFISDVDPAHRFGMLATMVRLKCPEVQTAIKRYTRQEYESVSETLARASLLHSPLAIALECIRWSRTETIAPVMEEYRTFNYDRTNLPIRVLFSHFLAFMTDKYAVPEFFCWPGSCMAGKGIRDDAPRLFERHSALFVDKEDDDGVFPRLHSDRDEELVQKTFETFYSAAVVYDLVDQWISKPGPFIHDLSWLSQTGTKENMAGFSKRSFEGAFGVNPDDVELV